MYSTATQLKGFWIEVDNSPGQVYVIYTELGYDYPLGKESICKMGAAGAVGAWRTAGVGNGSRDYSKTNGSCLLLAQALLVELDDKLQAG